MLRVVCKSQQADSTPEFSTFARWTLRSSNNVRLTKRSRGLKGLLQEVQFFCINNSAYDDLSSISDALASPSFVDGIDVNREAYPSSSASTTPGGIFEHPCLPLTKILSTGTFYYSTRAQWDLSTRLSARLERHAIHDPMTNFDERFVWNQFIAQPLLDLRQRLDFEEMDEFDRSQFLVRSRSPDFEPNLPATRRCY